MVEGGDKLPRAEAVPRITAPIRPDIHARRRIDAALAGQGIPRSERRAMMRQIGGMRDAAATAMPDAGLDPAALRQLIDTIRS